MNYSSHIAKLLRDTHFGGNWSAVSLKETLEGVTWQQAETKVQSFNTIAALVVHMNYYISILNRVLEGQPLEGSDKLSFDYVPVQSENEWQQMVNKLWDDVERLATLIEQFPAEKLDDTFIHKKYGNYYRNFHGITEHAHYHLGQIVLIKKMLP